MGMKITDVEKLTPELIAKHLKDPKPPLNCGHEKKLTDYAEDVVFAWDEYMKALRKGEDLPIALAETVMKNTVSNLKKNLNKDDSRIPLSDLRAMLVEVKDELPPTVGTDITNGFHYALNEIERKLKELEEKK